MYQVMNAFTIRGRADRLEAFMLHAVVAAPVLAIGREIAAVNTGLLALVGFALIVLAAWIGGCAGVRRLHDLNCSGWYYPMWVAAMVFINNSGLVELILLAHVASAVPFYGIMGTRGDNRYGPPPGLRPVRPVMAEFVQR